MQPDEEIDDDVMRILRSSTSAVNADELAAPENSEEAFALQFSAQFGNDLRYVAAWGKWLAWDGHRWCTDDTLDVYDRARGTCRAAAIEVDHPGLAARIAQAKTVAAIEHLARADRRHAAAVSQWDVDPWLLNTPSGVVDLRTGEVRPAERSLYQTKITAVGPDPDGACPLWLRFLHRITGGDAKEQEDKAAAYELQQFLRRMAGYALTGSIRDHAMFFLYGTGANGKSVFLQTIAGILGDYSRTAPIEAFTITNKSETQHPTDVAGLQGARLVTAVETEDGRRWAESKIRALTGGDPIAARFMRQDFFEFVPIFKLLIAGNHKPSLRGVDEAIRRRLHLLPFTVTIPKEERDPDLSQKIRKEWPAILQWMIDGCLDWQDKGLAAPGVVTDATEQYLSDEDAIGRWLEDACVRNPNAWSATRALFSSWTAWCERNKEYAGTQKRLAQGLESHGFKAQRTELARGFSGLAVKEDAR